MEEGGLAEGIPKYIVEERGSLEADVELVLSDVVASISHLRSELGKIRAGRASAGSIENIKVQSSSDGSAALPISKLGSIMASDAQSLVVNLFDASRGRAVVSALQGAGLNLAASAEGSKVLVKFPKMTREIREAMAKALASHGEACKRVVRDVRTAAISANGAFVKDLNVKRKGDVAIQKVYTDAIKSIDEMIKEKQREILA